MNEEFDLNAIDNFIEYPETLTATTAPSVPPLFTSLVDVEGHMRCVINAIDGLYGEGGLAVVATVLEQACAKYVPHRLQAAMDRINAEKEGMTAVNTVGGTVEEVAASLTGWYRLCAADPKHHKYFYSVELLTIVKSDPVNWLPWGSPLVTSLGWKRSKYFRVMRALCRLDWMVGLVGLSGARLMIEKVRIDFFEGSQNRDWEDWTAVIGSDEDIEFMKTVGTVDTQDDLIHGACSGSRAQTTSRLNGWILNRDRWRHCTETLDKQYVSCRQVLLIYLRIFVTDFRPSLGSNVPPVLNSVAANLN
ncbi:uncharacterized protein EV154DRAFT_486169 [Mucor mucedo]|uniref:uncharacterized protein n=1 Tax=Mucor mucedo TaxID=29922 RepID=UPI002220EF64|nr:uncharacterized protein EV154DRAFT_486169 [Mucor mucedo]KAI7878535.1 hypothetical protein EV154DRAFT_486169 [Mucor mucedo]